MDMTNSKCASFGDRCVTLNIIPSNRTDVDYFSITNSQTDDVVKVEPTERSVTVCLDPGTVTFTVDTVYTCPVTSDPDREFTLEILSECSYNLL